MYVMNPAMDQTVSGEKAVRCPHCWKPTSLCLCASLRPRRSPLKLLVLQHPDEAENPLGTARLLSLSVEGAVHAIGHTWKNLGHALGLPRTEKVNLKEWAVLFVGTKKNAPEDKRRFALLSRSGEPIPNSTIRGIVLLDGNWSQAKTLWWRNSWLLRHPRIFLNPPTPSAYTNVRRQPRKNYLSTIEAAAFCVENIVPNSKLPAELRQIFQRFLSRCVPTPSTESPPPEQPQWTN